MRQRRFPYEGFGQAWVMPQVSELDRLVDLLATAEDTRDVQNRLQTIEARIRHNPPRLAPHFIALATDLLMDSQCRQACLCAPLLDTLGRVAGRYGQQSCLMERGLERVLDLARQDSGRAGLLLETLEQTVMSPHASDDLRESFTRLALPKLPLLARFSPAPAVRLLQALRVAGQEESTVLAEGLSCAGTVAAHGERPVTLAYLTALAEIATGTTDVFSPDRPVRYGPRGSMLCDVFMAVAFDHPADTVIVLFRNPLDTSPVYAPGYERCVPLGDFQAGVATWEGVSSSLPPHVPRARQVASLLEAIGAGRLVPPRLDARFCRPAP